MERSSFIKLLGGGLGYGVLHKTWDIWIKQSEEVYPELKKHKISTCDLGEIKFHWPRFVGKNGRIDFHGQHKKCPILKIRTDQGALGWGLSNKSVIDKIPGLQNKKVSDLIIPGKGIKEGLDRTVDFALHDLMGKILKKPVYQLLGSKGNPESPIYSGMIYLDELNPGNESKGLDVILENCAWDFNYGYRQLKVKIGRSGRWYPHKEGLAKDIEVVRKIHEIYKNRNTQILVDSNDMYTLEDTIQFLEGVRDVPLFWVEEPFREELESGRKLKKWMDKHGFEDTLYADGEANPMHELCLQLGKEGMMDVFLPDIFGYGFTEWTKLAPVLNKIQMLSSPHAWGNRLKTNYITHLAAGLGGVTTIEGVTCMSEDVDYGDYPIIDGKIRVSDAPGFGMSLLN